MAKPSRPVLSRILTVGLLLLASAIGALALAALAVRTPAMWSAVPDVVYRLAHALLEPATQEDVADAEVLALWFCGFVALGVGGGVACLLRRRFRKPVRDPSIPGAGAGASRVPPFQRRGRWLRIAVHGTAAFLFGWLVLHPHPYTLSVWTGVCFVAALAIGAAVLPDRMRLENSLSVADPHRVHVLADMVVVSVALAIRALVDHQVTVGPPLLLWVGAAGAVLSLSLWIAVKRARFWTSVGVGTLFAAAVVVHADGLGTSGAPRVDKGTVARKYTSTRPQGHTVVVRTAHDETHVRVGRAAYDGYAPGREACIVWRHGLLGIDRRALAPCDDVGLVERRVSGTA